MGTSADNYHRGRLVPYPHCLQAVYLEVKDAVTEVSNEVFEVFKSGALYS